MKIKSISIFKFPIEFGETKYVLSGGRVCDGLDGTLVRIDTACGITGWGEISPWGRNYLPEFAEGARATINSLAPDLIGQNPSNPAQITALMDKILYGHLYAKAAIDTACWDILGKKSGLPIHTLLGGAQTDSIPLLGSLYHGPADDMIARVEAFRAKGIHSYSAKASGNIETDCDVFPALLDQQLSTDTFIIDANAGWSVSGAVTVLNKLRDYRFMVEQPCRTLAECLRVRQKTQQPTILDESIIESDNLVQILTTNAADVLHFKISRIGGLTKARMIRDFCALSGYSTFWEGSGGGGIASTAAAHVALSAPIGYPHVFWSCEEFNREPTCKGGTDLTNGFMTLGNEPGLGAEPFSDLTKSPLAQFG